MLGKVESHTWVDFWPLILAYGATLLRLHVGVDAETLISFIPFLTCRLSNLGLIREAHHKLRSAHGNLVTAIDLPEVVGFAVQSNDFTHLLGLGGFPDSTRDRRRCGHLQKSAL